MIIVMKRSATKEQVDALIKRINRWGFETHLSKGDNKTVIGVIGKGETLQSRAFLAFEGVENVMQVNKPYKLVSREFHPENTVIDVKNAKIGGKKITVMAGPCSVENGDMVMKVAESVSANGATILRGGAFKPRTSPYSFQGLGEEGLKILRESADATGMKVITEVMDVRDVELIEKYTDIFQIGARNMANFSLLKEVGKTKKPVMLKRGMSATLQEFLLAAEYIMNEGNEEVILCERGIRTFEQYTRNTLDLAIVPAIKELSHLPIVVDPSHATGRKHLVIPMALAAIASGADGIMVEVHPNPAEALSDGVQALLPSDFNTMMKAIEIISKAVGRTIS
ncbi:MAG: 3-deoxy-7-phosphoheptulonate synthase [Epsilonproteobacteria bacterium]|nr:3-deoxy-7-phosphoheptulonate synthase [Campylobacterota bacterium]